MTTSVEVTTDRAPPPAAAAASPQLWTRIASAAGGGPRAGSVVGGVLVIDGAQVRTTEDHPFGSVSDQRYERADHLSPGEQVLTAGGRTATVEAIIDDQPVLAPA